MIIMSWESIFFRFSISFFLVLILIRKKPLIYFTIHLLYPCMIFNHKTWLILLYIICEHHVGWRITGNLFRKFSHKEQGDTVFENYKKVSFNIASEASYVYILSWQNIIKNAKNGPILESCWKIQMRHFESFLNNVGEDNLLVFIIVE